MMALIALARMIPAWLIVALAALVSALWIGYSAGSAGVQSRWDADRAERARTELMADAARNVENSQIAKNNAAIAADIERESSEKINAVRRDLAAERLRRGAGICAGPASAPGSAIPAGGDATNPGGGLFRADVERDIVAALIKMEEVASTGHACQDAARAYNLTQ